MRFTVRDVIRVMDDWAPPGLAYDWDRIGLSLGRPDAPVRRVLTALSVTPDTADAALRAKADLIVSHHPVIWDPIKALRTDHPNHAALLRLAAGKVNCYAAHTNLDVCVGGVNDVLAEALGLRETTPLFPAKHSGMLKLVTFVPETHLAAVRDAVSRAGAGEIGGYTHCSFATPGVGTFLPGASAKPFSGTRGKVNEEPEHRFETLVQKAILGRVLEALRATHPYEEVAYDLIPLQNPDPRIGLGRVGVLAKPLGLRAFAQRVRKALGAQHARVVGDPKQSVQRIAVLGGAGGSQIPQVPAGIDAYVTGDVKYHEAQAALERGLAVIDAGHHGTEHGIVPVIAARLRAALPGLDVQTYDEPDPFFAFTKQEGANTA